MDLKGIKDAETRAKAERYYDSLKLAQYRILVTRPVPMVEGDIKRSASGRLFLSAQSTETRMSWGQVARVLKVGPGCDRHVVAGAHVVLPERAGTVILDGDRETELVIIGDGDVMAVLE